MSIHKRNKRVFIVEDDPMSMEILHGLILDIDPDAEIDWSKSAEGALDLIEEDKNAGRDYDLIIADIFLSEKETGLDLWKRCLEKFNGIPLVITSALPLHQYFSTVGQEIHAPTFLAKPYQLNECRALLEGLLGTA